MAIAAQDEPEPLMGMLLLAPAGAAVMTSGMTIASAGTAARRAMAERNMALVIAFSRKGAGAVAGRRGRNSNRNDLASHIPGFRDRHATGPGQQTPEVPTVTCSRTNPRAARAHPGHKSTKDCPNLDLGQERGRVADHEHKRQHEARHRGAS